MSLNRTLANLINTDGDVKAANLDLAASITVVEALDSLPTSNLTAGDQAYVKGTSRFYVSNGAGWYNAALVNATPSLSIDPSGAITLATDGSTTIITLTATDSDYPDAALTYTVESDGSFGGLATLSQDSSVFTITPLNADSATTASAVLTFKASDGVSFGSGDRTLTLSFKVENSNYTTLLSKADTAGTDNQVDASTSAHTITEAGNVTSTAFTPYHPGGYSTYFDGTGDYISIADGTYKTLGSDPWTYECWVYPTSVAAGNKWILGDHASNGSGTTTSVNFVLNGANFGIFCRTSTSSYIDVVESTTRSINQWYHLALVFDQSNVILYVDGTAVITQSHTSGFNDGSGSFSVGRTGDYNGAYFSGYVRDVRLVKGTAVYTSSFTPPTAPLTAISGTEILICHLPYIADGSSNSLATAVSGNTKPERFGPYDYFSYEKADHGGSVYFDGTDDKMSIANSADFNLSSGSWTIECWVYLTGSYSKYYTLFAKRISNAGSSTSIEGYIKQTTGALSWYNGTEIVSTGVVKQNTWSHCAWTHNGTNLKMFLNGENVYDNAISITEINYPLYIGGLDGNTGEDFEGYISDFRVVKGTEVYTSNFTPPTAPVTAVTNTKLLTCTNKNDIWDVGSGNLLTKVGNTTASNTQRKFTGSSAIYLDGTDDYLDAGDIQFGASDFTIEGWFYFNSTANQCLIGRFHNYSSNQCWELIYEGGMRFQTNAGSFNSGTVAFTVQTSQWYHIAAVRSGSNKYLFIDGVLQSGYPINIGTGALQGETTGTVKIGTRHDLTKDFNGYIQDLRITKGLARYTATFTPPTTEFSG